MDRPEENQGEGVAETTSESPVSGQADPAAQLQGQPDDPASVAQQQSAAAESTEIESAVASISLGEGEQEEPLAQPDSSNDNLAQPDLPTETVQTQSEQGLRTPPTTSRIRVASKSPPDDGSKPKPKRLKSDTAVTSQDLFGESSSEEEDEFDLAARMAARPVSPVSPMTPEGEGEGDLVDLIGTTFPQGSYRPESPLPEERLDFEAEEDDLVPPSTEKSPQPQAVDATKKSPQPQAVGADTVQDQPQERMDEGSDVSGSAEGLAISEEVSSPASSAGQGQAANETSPATPQAPTGGVVIRPGGQVIALGGGFGGGFGGQSILKPRQPTPDPTRRVHFPPRAPSAPVRAPLSGSQSSSFSNVSVLLRVVTREEAEQRHTDMWNSGQLEFPPPADWPEEGLTPLQAEAWRRAYKVDKARDAPWIVLWEGSGAAGRLEHAAWRFPHYNQQFLRSNQAVARPRLVRQFGENWPGLNVAQNYRPTLMEIANAPMPMGGWENIARIASFGRYWRAQEEASSRSPGFVLDPLRYTRAYLELTGATVQEMARGFFTGPAAGTFHPISPTTFMRWRTNVPLFVPVEPQAQQANVAAPSGIQNVAGPSGLQSSQLPVPSSAGGSRQDSLPSGSARGRRQKGTPSGRPRDAREILNAKCQDARQTMRARASARGPQEGDDIQCVFDRRADQATSRGPSPRRPAAPKPAPARSPSPPLTPAVRLLRQRRVTTAADLANLPEWRPTIPPVQPGNRDDADSASTTVRGQFSVTLPSLRTSAEAGATAAHPPTLRGSAPQAGSSGAKISTRDPSSMVGSIRAFKAAQIVKAGHTAKEALGEVRQHQVPGWRAPVNSFVRWAKGEVVPLQLEHKVPQGKTKVNYYNATTRETGTFARVRLQGQDFFALVPFEPGHPTFDHFVDVVCALTPKNFVVTAERNIGVEMSVLMEEMSLEDAPTVEEWMAAMAVRTSYEPEYYLKGYPRGPGNNDDDNAGARAAGVV